MRLFGRDSKGSKHTATRDPLRDALLAVAVVAVVVAGLLGWAWASAAQDSQLSYAIERDTVLDAATDGLVTLHTIDYRTVEEDLDRWVAATGGDLHDDLDGDRQGQREKAEANETVAAAELVEAAVTELDTYDGEAEVIAVLAVEISGGTDGEIGQSEEDGESGEQEPAGTRRMNASLVETEQGWKITSIEAAA